MPEEQVEEKPANNNIDAPTEEKTGDVVDGESKEENIVVPDVVKPTEEAGEKDLQDSEVEVVGIVEKSTTTNINPILIGSCIGNVLMLAILVAVIIRCVKKKMNLKKEESGGDGEKKIGQTPPAKPIITIGKLHHVGKRPTQQDSMGVLKVDDGRVLAIVADGMGGLSDGDKYSQSIVYSVMNSASALLKKNQADVLYRLIAQANHELNTKFLANGAKPGGSTLLLVLFEQGRFSWASVGDSRIYLYRGGSLIQMNSEHMYLRELINRAVNQEISFEQALTDPQKNRLTSCLGMGELKYIDGSFCNVKLQPGDRVVLMSDGVFHTLSEETIESILRSNNHVQDAANMIQEEILRVNNPKQDNFTAVILGWD